MYKKYRDGGFIFLYTLHNTDKVMPVKNGVIKQRENKYEYHSII
ncbi:hypothetical protein TPE_2692 [Treponema pedis str. T A4]|uniref:Uncharacterized protein n=1 Tax=Treponema pedis str. T A4 TaxID=1291379 RepID=S6A991_9SPIR|nr:hypothetical protein TPE_2692 [Treponema pedis str. T A4]